MSLGASTGVALTTGQSGDEKNGGVKWRASVNH